MYGEHVASCTAMAVSTYFVGVCNTWRDLAALKRAAAVVQLFPNARALSSSELAERMVAHPASRCFILSAL